MEVENEVKRKQQSREHSKDILVQYLFASNYYSQKLGRANIFSALSHYLSVLTQSRHYLFGISFNIYAIGQDHGFDATCMWVKSTLLLAIGL